MKSRRYQITAERARVSAPLGYSENNTGLAINIGYAYNRETDFKVVCEDKDALNLA